MAESFTLDDVGDEGVVAAKTYLEQVLDLKAKIVADITYAYVSISQPTTGYYRSDYDTNSSSAPKSAKGFATARPLGLTKVGRGTYLYVGQKEVQYSAWVAVEFSDRQVYLDYDKWAYHYIIKKLPHLKLCYRPGALYWNDFVPWFLARIICGETNSQITAYDLQLYGFAFRKRSQTRITMDYLLADQLPPFATREFVQAVTDLGLEFEKKKKNDVVFSEMGLSRVEGTQLLTQKIVLRFMMLGLARKGYGPVSKIIGELFDIKDFYDDEVSIVVDGKEYVKTYIPIIDKQRKQLRELLAAYNEQKNLVSARVLDISALRRQLEKSQLDIKQLKGKHKAQVQNELKQVKSAHKVLLEKIKSDHETELHRLQTGHAQELSVRAKEHQRIISDIVMEKERAVAQAKKCQEKVVDLEKQLLFKEQIIRKMAGAVNVPPPPPGRRNSTA